MFVVLWFVVLAIYYIGLILAYFYWVLWVCALSSVPSGFMLDNLGLVAAKFDELGIGRILDEKLPKRSGVPYSVICKGFCLNAVGFVNRRLYLHPQFFGKVPVKRLFGRGVDSDSFNETNAGRFLDLVYAYGPVELYNEVAFALADKKVVMGCRLHCDTTSFSVYGEGYENGEKTISINKGHPKNYRRDLNMFVLSIISNQHGVPLFLKAFSGNESDKKILPSIIREVKSNLKAFSESHYIADSAFYTEDNLRGIGSSVRWISRVPDNLALAREFMDSGPCTNVLEDHRYSFKVKEVEYAGVKQKWVLFDSAPLREVKASTFDRNLEKKLERDRKDWWHLCNHDFVCVADALKAGEAWLKKRPYLRFEDLSTVEHYRRIDGKKGRPGKNTTKTSYYRLKADLQLNQESVEKDREKLSYFIIATNDQGLEPGELLEYYKEQGTVERGFRFLKDKQFHVSDVYLKKNERIEALAMIMVLCLLVYTLLEKTLRDRLKELNMTILDQKRRPTQKPTMRWVFMIFQSIAEIHYKTKDGPQSAVTNIQGDVEKILDVLGPTYKKIYS